MLNIHNMKQESIVNQSSISTTNTEANELILISFTHHVLVSKNVFLYNNVQVTGKWINVQILLVKGCDVTLCEAICMQ